MTQSLVRGTSLVGDVVLVDPHVGVSGVPSETAAVEFVAGEENLRGKVDVGPLRLSHYFYTVAEGGSGGESPARSAVCRNVLIFLDGQVVGAVDVTPPEVSRQLRWLYFRERVENFGFESCGGDEVGQ